MRADKTQNRTAISRTHMHTYVVYAALGAVIALLVAANGFMWNSIQSKIAALEEDVAEQKKVQEEITAEQNTERPSVEERTEILNSLKQNPEGLSVEERRAVLQSLSANVGNGE